MLHYLLDYTLHLLKGYNNEYFPQRKWMDKLSFLGHSKWERTILLGFIFVICLFSARLFTATRIFSQSTIYVYPMLGILLYIIAKAFEKCYFLYIKKDHRIKTLRYGLNNLLAFAGVNFFFGILSYYLELYRFGGTGIQVASHLLLITQKMAPGADDQLTHLVNWMMRYSSTWMVCFIITSIGLMVWFLLESKIRSIEYDEADCLLSS